MLLVQDNILKLGGVKLTGQVKSVDITETATIEDIEDDKGKTKANQPTGYEAAKITVEFILEDSKKETTLEQIKKMQKLFKPYGQKKAKLLKITNEDCAARGISKVYFEKLSTSKVISESKRTATLELLAPTIAGIKTKKKGSGSKKTSSKKSAKKSKSTKDRSKSPLAKKKSASKAKSRARKIVK